MSQLVSQKNQKSCQPRQSVHRRRGGQRAAAHDQRAAAAAAVAPASALAWAGDGLLTLHGGWLPCQLAGARSFMRSYSVFFSPICVLRPPPDPPPNPPANPIDLSCTEQPLLYGPNRADPTPCMRCFDCPRISTDCAHRRVPACLCPSQHHSRLQCLAGSASLPLPCPSLACP